jgi:hypothetical protein
MCAACTSAINGARTLPKVRGITPAATAPTPHAPAGPSSAAPLRGWYAEGHGPAHWGSGDRTAAHPFPCGAAWSPTLQPIDPVDECLDGHRTMCAVCETAAFKSTCR